MRIMELFRTILRSQKNELNAGPPPESPVLTSLSRSRMMSAMSRRTTTMQPISIVVNKTFVRFGARQKT